MAISTSTTGAEQLSLFMMPVDERQAASPKSALTLGQHTAAPQLAGYLFQVQTAMMRLFDLGEGEALGIEIVDDWHVEAGGTPTELAQVKHHVGARSASLSDGSVDLWKTLGIWAGAIGRGELEPTVVRRFLLITNAELPAGSVVEKLAHGAAPDEIIDLLLAVPRSTDLKVGPYFDAFHGLEPEKRRAFVERLEIAASGPSLADSNEVLRRMLARRGFHPHSADTAVDRFCGWVWGKLTTRLTAASGLIIREDEFHAAWRAIRDELTGAALPARFLSADSIDEAALVGQDTATYMRQLDLIGASDNVKRRSLSTYFRASSERNTWIDRGEIVPDHLRRYDDELIDRWRQRFDNMCDDMLTCTDETELRRAGLLHFRAIEEFNVPVQPDWLHQYLTRGSYHILADSLKVGWHPLYHARLKRPGSVAEDVNDER
jgi:hypothetical protein